MSWNKANYDEVRNKIAVGDVIAFGSYCAVSEMVKWITHSSVSHVGVVLDSSHTAQGVSQGEDPNKIIESTEDVGVWGVRKSPLDTVISKYDGEIWWLPLSDEVRNRMDMNKFQDFLTQQIGKPFDLTDATALMLDRMLHLHPDLTENYGKFFCSELVVAGLDAGGAFPHIDSADITPACLCSLKIFNGNYFQLKGDDTKKINRYNRLNPEMFAEK